MFPAPHTAPSKPNEPKSSSSTKTSITRTGLVSATWHPDTQEAERLACGLRSRRSASSKPPEHVLRKLSLTRRFHTASVGSGRSPDKREQPRCARSGHSGDLRFI
jgi:hypothetical protein